MSTGFSILSSGYKRPLDFFFFFLFVAKVKSRDFRTISNEKTTCLCGFRGLAQMISNDFHEISQVPVK